MSVSFRRTLVLFAVFLIAMPEIAGAWTPVRRLDLRIDASPIGTASALANPGFSADGRWLVFSSSDSGFVAGDSNGVSDVFVMDTQSGVVSRPVRRIDGSATQGFSRLASISGNGRYIVFISADAALVPGDTNARADVFVLDRDSNGNGIFDEPAHTAIVRASLDSAGNPLTAGSHSVMPAISDDGRQVVFDSTIALVQADTNGARDVYVRNLAQGTTILASASAAGVVGSLESPDTFDAPLKIDASGRRVAFTSRAENLVAGGSNARDDVFVRDRDSDGNGIVDEPGNVRMTCASTLPDGSPINDHTRQFDLSADGGWLAFSQFRSLIVPDPNPDAADIYVRRLADSALSVISLAGSPAGKTTGGNQRPLLSADGRVVLFTSCQNRVIGGATVGRCDAVSSLPGDPPVLSRLTDYPVPNSTTDGWSGAALALSRDGRHAVVQITDHANTTSGYRYELYKRALPDAIFAHGFEP